MEFLENVVWAGIGFEEYYEEDIFQSTTTEVLGTETFFEAALEEYHTSLYAEENFPPPALQPPPTVPPTVPPTPTIPTPTLPTPTRDPIVFATYITLRHIIPGHPQEGWMVTNTRTVFERDSASTPSLKSGRSVPPPVECGDWNVWTVGNFRIRSTKGGLHLNFLREVLRRTDGVQRGKWGRKVLESGIDKERNRQVSKGLIVDRPQNWNENSGWWVYVQPM